MDLDHGAAEQHVPGHLRFDGLGVPEPEFADDDGTLQPALAEVLAAFAQGCASVRDVALVVSSARLMTPLVAVLDEVEESAKGHRQEKSSHMASVSVVTPDGRRGLLAFGSVQSMAAWDPAARGIPAYGAKAAAGALEQHADALVLDVAGPVRVAIEGALLRALAAGAPLPMPYADPSVHAAVVSALAGLDGVLDAVLEAPEPGPGAADLVVLVSPREGADVELLARQVAERLVAHPAVAAACPRGVAVGLAPSTS